MPRKAKTKKKKKKRSGHISHQHNNSDGYDEPEIWDLKRQIRRNQECGCHTPDCTEQAIAVWASNKTTAANEWFTCEECQLKDFGGWPEGEVPVNNDSNINNDLKKEARKKIASAVAKPAKTRKSGNDDKYPPSIEKQASTISGSAAKKGAVISSAISDVIVNDGDGKELAVTPKSGSLGTRNTPLSSDTIDGGKESSFKTPSPEQRQVVQRVVTPPSPLMRREKPERNLATIRYCTGQDRQDWTRWQPLYSIPCRSAKPEEPFVCNLRRGGTVKIYPNLVQTMETERVKEELFNCRLFRQYQIQAQDEPRLHFLLNEKATKDNFETSSQPGYRYAGVKMKARPLKILPELEQLSQRLATVSGINKWTIGVNPVLYRDCRDKMGSHADDDQGEQVILCLIVSSPQEARRVIITPKDKKPNLEAGDETIELILQPGDA
jgi:alkylated DNA repair dioxygenase AlkB